MESWRWRSNSKSICCFGWLVELGPKLLDHHLYTSACACACAEVRVLVFVMYMRANQWFPLCFNGLLMRVFLFIYFWIYEMSSWKSSSFSNPVMLALILSFFSTCWYLLQALHSLLFSRVHATLQPVFFCLSLYPCVHPCVRQSVDPNSCKTLEWFSRHPFFRSSVLPSFRTSPTAAHRGLSSALLSSDVEAIDCFQIGGWDSY